MSLLRSIHNVVEECEKRDPKGLYKKAHAGEIPEFTGISAPYEAPEHPEIILDTENETIEESVIASSIILKHIDIFKD